MVKEPEAIDFAAYKARLKFTGASVDSIEAMYKNTSLPTYTATLPAFEVKKRSVMLDVVQSTVEAAKADLEALNGQIAAFEQGRMTTETSTEELKKRFPAMGSEIEAEIKAHNWMKSITN
jgi:hypothetical protein